MIRHHLVTVLGVLAILSDSSAANGANDPAEAMAGHWSGTATLRGDATAFGLDIRPNAAGALAVFVYLPETHVSGDADGVLTASETGFTSDSLALTLVGESLRGRYATSIELDLHRSESPPFAAELPELPQGPTPAWTWRAAASIWASPTVDRGVVFIGSADGALHALRARDGKLLWGKSLGAGIFGAALVKDGTLYVVNDRDELFALSCADGRQHWKVPLSDTPRHRSLPSAGEDSEWDYRGAAPAESAGVLYVGASDGGFHALDAHSGRSLWHFQAQGPIRSTALIAGNQVYIASFDHHVYALDQHSGHLLWNADVGASVTTDPVLAGNRVVVGTRGYRLLALEPGTGSIAWSRFQWFSWVESTPRVLGQTLLVGSSDNRKLRELNAEDGSTRWSTDLNGYAFGQPALAGDMAFEATAAGPPVPGKATQRAALFAVDRHNGELRWTRPAGASLDSYLAGFTGSALIAGNRLLIGGLDGILYAYPVAVRSTRG
jgi:outer membrane protein assembly factor BamB